jgi:hypothetical protein
VLQILELKPCLKLKSLASLQYIMTIIFFLIDLASINGRSVCNVGLYIESVFFILQIIQSGSFFFKLKVNLQ